MSKASGNIRVADHKHSTRRTPIRRWMEDLQKERDLAREYLDIAGVMLVAIAGDQEISMINKKGCEVLGCRQEEIVGKNWFDNFLPESIRDEIRAVFARLMAGEIEALEHYENPVLTRSGEERLIAWHNTVLRDKNGAITGTLSSGEDITERREAEEALQESERRFRLIFDNSNDHIIFTDPNVVVVKTNGRCWDIFGYRPEEVIGHNVMEIGLFDKDELSRLAELIKGSLSEGAAAKPLLEVEAKHKDGHKISVEVSTRLMTAEDGTPEGFVSIIRDITERKRTEEAVYLKENAIENSLSAMAISDIQGSLTYVNQACLKLWQRDSKEELLGKPYWELLELEDAAIAADIARAMIENGYWEGDLAARRKDGSEIHVHVLTAIIKDGRGKPIQTISSFVDITERRKAEKAIRESEEKYRELVNTSIDGVISVDSRMEILLWNPGAERILGYTEEEMLGQSLMKVIPERYRKAKRKGVALYGKSGSGPIIGKVVDVEGLRKDGTEVPIELSVSSRKVGETYVATAILRDITERRKAEEERTRLSAEIEEKNKELEHIVYVSSHDLRSPLVNIQGFSKELNYSLHEMVSILQNEEISPEVRERLAPIVETDIADALMYIQASILKMDSLLSGLLRLSRLGRAALSFEQLDINQMVSEIVKGNEYRIKGARVTVEVGDLPPCMGDAVQINQVVSNLVDNALKYLDLNKPGVIKVTGRVDGDRAIYCVEDNGIGIDGEDQAKIFEIFHQLNPRSSAGEGLGLSVVKKILSRNDGMIWVESEPGVGSKFFVSLPAVK